jgi:hypothetical protein
VISSSIDLQNPPALPAGFFLEQQGGYLPKHPASEMAAALTFEGADR